MNSRFHLNVKYVFKNAIFPLVWILSFPPNTSFSPQKEIHCLSFPFFKHLNTAFFFFFLLFLTYFWNGIFGWAELPCYPVWFKTWRSKPAVDRVELLTSHNTTDTWGGNPASVGGEGKKFPIWGHVYLRPVSNEGNAETNVYTPLHEHPRQLRR